MPTPIHTWLFTAFLRCAERPLDPQCCLIHFKKSSTDHLRLYTRRRSGLEGRSDRSRRRAICGLSDPGGVISGDKVTTDWDRACPCGREGAFIHGDIERYPTNVTGDDKITCAATVDNTDAALQKLLAG